MTNESPRHRKWFQFRLRAILIGVLVLSLPLSWFAVRMARARRQREAVEEIHRLGGLIIRLESSDPNDTFDPPVGCLRRLCGDNSFHGRPKVLFFKMIEWHESPSTAKEVEICDDDLKTLASLPDNWSLTIESSRVTDEGVKHLYCLRHLEHLDLIGTQVTPEGVKRLQEALPKCKIDY